MKKIIGLFLFLFVVILSSCSANNAGDPAEATLKYLTALAEKDKTQIVNLSCKNWEDQATLEADALLSVGSSLNNVSCSVIGKEGDLQLVKCLGALDLTYGEEIRSIDLSLRTYFMAIEEGQWRVCDYK